MAFPRTLRPVLAVACMRALGAADVTPTTGWFRDARAAAASTLGDLAKFRTIALDAVRATAPGGLRVSQPTGTCCS